MAAPAKEQTSPPWNPPDHWDDVDKLGDAIPMGTSAGTLAKLVAARVPLDAKYTTPVGEQWTPSHLLEECQARKLAVNMVIDLTNTFKYYDGIAEFQAKGVEYVKIKVEGFADVPKEDIVQRFITVLSTWEHKLKQRKTEVVSEDEMTPVVIVHCTHGLNRTGYLVARYLIATRGISVKEALATFTAARPPGLIKHMYVKTLYNMFDQGGDIVLPTLPHWALHKYDRSKNELAAANNMPRIASTQPFDRKQHRLNESNLRRPPANWTDPPRMGDVVADSPFLPMRTLLDDSFDHGADPWTPDVFVAEQALRGHDVRLVVDLTNTTKYYNGPSAFAIHGIQYEKFALEGFSAAPSTASVAAFLDLVDAFEKTHPNAGHLALHCTHGLNRTGYLVACYLITRKNYSVQAALDAFATARPPGLIKFLYIDALHRMYSHGISTDNIKYPALPPWASKKYAKRATPPQSRTSTRRLWPPPSHWATTLPHGNWITVRRSEDVPIPVDAASATDALGGAHGTRTHKQAIEPTMRTLHLLPMKAMLDDRFDSDGSWTPHSFVSFVESGGGGPVHGVVSFCERNAYYTDDHLPSTLRRTYLPIRSGHVPHQSDVDAFYRVLDLWHGEVGRDMDLRVALHCSVGSRTGFYAIQCLVDFAHHTVDEAKAIYEAAWPPGFITKSFLKNLYFVERKNQMRLETTREDDAWNDVPTDRSPKTRPATPTTTAVTRPETASRGRIDEIKVERSPTAAVQNGATRTAMTDSTRKDAAKSEATRQDVGEGAIAAKIENLLGGTAEGSKVQAGTVETG
ncbi:hypothetical protein H310_14100 [Aphanomyces invadans]|uniref:Tyrosine specific protein phosphatases domain-containing protein n=1 Tax=Aphanomyces invadans TaxID=157072 RepID=A0A024TD02_9STRA|nr:hypothetical protein H310_14100 [Aphanomyces invadans]ETV91237.1 hypothetical protein H310_14100 [Aphanomyces invadans]|eukprot:XP_008880074.1 hypothetical protein H310_14100 [Aphanomyces invadans]